MEGLICIAAAGLLPLIYVIVQYNSLVGLQNHIRDAWSNIGTELQRRYDLIPNLVETAKGYLKHERETLEAVIAARNQAVSANNKAAEAPSDPAAIQAMIGAESALGGSIGRLFALMENYPDLKGNENMLSVQEELSSTENRIGFARQAYNDSVMSYNARQGIVSRYSSGRYLRISGSSLLAD